jgi:hypothetical protein
MRASRSDGYDGPLAKIEELEKKHPLGKYALGFRAWDVHE